MVRLVVGHSLPLGREQGRLTPQPAADLAETEPVGHTHVGEEHLVEVPAAVHGPQRADVHAGADVEHEEGQARVLGNVRVGTREQDRPVRDVGEAGPHLLAVDHPLLAVPCGRGAQIGQIGAGVGLAEQLAPVLLVREGRTKPTTFEVVAGGVRVHAAAAWCTPT